MHCNLESNEEGTKTHVSHMVLQVVCQFSKNPFVGLLNHQAYVVFFASSILLKALYQHYL